MVRAIFIIALFGLLNFFAAARIINRWPAAEQHAGGAWAAVLIFFVLQLLAPFGDRLFFEKIRKHPHMGTVVSIVDWISYAAFGVMSLLAAYGMAIDIVRLISALLYKNFDPDAFDHYALYAIFAATLLTATLGAFNVCCGPQVKEVNIPLQTLPAGLDGFKIAQVSDLHVGAAIRRGYTQNVVDIVNRLQPDLIALTGDFVDGSVNDLMDDIAPLSSLRAPAGVFFVTGNHEYYSGASAWIEAFKKLNMRVLINEHVIIPHANDAFILAGVTDYRAGDIAPRHASDPAKALSHTPAGLVRILLAHQPASCRKAAEAGVDLQLSGHTHGGQYFPFTFLIRFFQRYYSGLNKYKNMWLYINRGTGYWGPPFRTGGRGEITLITLRHALEISSLD